MTNNNESKVLNIYQRINLVMLNCDYLQKKDAQMGKGIRYDDVMAMIRPLLIKHGIVMVTTQSTMECLNNVEGTKQKIYEGSYTLKLVNIDDPKDFVEHTSFAHGMDGGDKGAGKAHTYAMKTMLVKGFGLETGEDEESRSEKLDKQNTITDEQYRELAAYCVTTTDNGVEWSPTGKRMMAAYTISDIKNLPASKFTEALTRAKKNANSK